MAKQMITQVFDDLDGSEDATTVRFGLDTVAYEIDLSAVHEKELRAVLAPYVEAARRAQAGGRSPARRSPVRSGPARLKATRPVVREASNAEVREWALQHGHPVAGRGRIAQSVRDAFAAAA